MEALEDLFASHLELAALLEASTSILEVPRPDSEQVSRAIARADLRWSRFWRTGSTFA